VKVEGAWLLGERKLYVDLVAPALPPALDAPGSVDLRGATQERRRPTRAGV